MNFKSLLPYGNTGHERVNNLATASGEKEYVESFGSLSQKSVKLTQKCNV